MELISHSALAHLHPTGPHLHPESPDRIRRLHAHFSGFTEGSPATRGQVERVHSADYIGAVDALDLPSRGRRALREPGEVRV